MDSTLVNLNESLGPSFGWGDPVYRQTSAWVLGVLFLSAALVFWLRKKNAYWSVSWQSIKSWILVAPILFLFFGLREPVPLVVLSLLAVFGTKVFFQLLGMYHRNYFVLTCYAGIIGLSLCVWIGNRDLYNLMPMLVLGLSCLIPLARNNFVKMIQYISLTQLAFVFLGWSFLHLAWIVREPQGLYQLMYLIILTEFCDNTNLALSRVLGKRLIFDRIDRRRTLAGLCVSALATLTLAFAMRFLLPDSGVNSWWVAGLIASLGGFVGDMVMTVLRKDAGIMVVGPFILGRGDFLHRMDRLIFVAPIYYFVLVGLSL